MKYNSRGFTLFELLVAMILLTFIVGMVFELLTSFLSTTDVLQTEQGRMDKMAALRSFLSYRLASIPSDFHVLSSEPESTEGGILLGTDTRYSVFDIEIQPNGLFGLRMAAYSPPKKGAFTNLETVSPSMLENYRANKTSLIWTGLLKDLKSCQWRFFDRPTGKWSDTWTYLDHNPGVIEATLQISGEADSATFDFPIIQLAPEPLFIQFASGSSPQTLQQATPLNSPSGQPIPTPGPNPNQPPAK